MVPPVLNVNSVSVRFGGIVAVSNVSFAVGKGEFIGLIGPNGAGKTTLLRTIAGLNTNFDGAISINGHDVSHDRVATRIRSGLSLSHQIVRPFRSMSILENVMLAVGMAHTSSALRAALSVDKKCAESEARRLLDLVGISAAADQSPTTQPLGTLKRLEVARALGSRPSVLLLDEPLAGLGSAEATKMADLLIGINQRGVTIVLIEHNLIEARRACRRFIVLDNGRLLADGPVESVLRDHNVITAYLGSEGRNA